MIVLNFIFSFNFTFVVSVLIFSVTYNPNYYSNQCSTNGYNHSGGNGYTNCINDHTVINKVM